MVTTLAIFKVLAVFKLYGKFSGARLNQSKSKELWFGLWQIRSENPGSLKWTNKNLKIFGCYFGSDQPLENTWHVATTKFCEVLEHWNDRFLVSTWQGNGNQYTCCIETLVYCQNLSSIETYNGKIEQGYVEIYLE